MPAAQSPASLKEAFKGHFLVGAALNQSQFDEEDTNAVGLIKSQFNTITPENSLKWEAVHPQPGKYNFEQADRYVAFGEKYGMFIVGHNLVWHSQTPQWVFKDESGKPIGREALLARMREHILTVVGRYKGRIRGWDVVNEAVQEDGSLRKSPWLQGIGTDYLVKAYEFAHEADPNLELYYNDYSLENARKRKGAVALVKSLQAQGIQLTAIGLQGHYKMDWPATKDIEKTVATFAKLGLKVMITELDVDLLPTANDYKGADVAHRLELRKELDPYVNGLPDAKQEALAARYSALFSTFLKHPEITRVTFWGVTDTGSWLNDWPMRGRTSYPLLFDRNYQPKPAFDAVIGTAAKHVTSVR